ncbi:hypothetical protein ElyMa_002516700 [Elysia marginata]|uniref:Uncharacterized protein n=1 Tax=Elysia marginata TaxID=1093978 RepID=A0AAV4GST7_9GAST|nr:hypothetical protein ElyMa_002516700 [Elysia marginata]
MWTKRPSEVFLLSVVLICLVLYLVVNYSVGKRTPVKLGRMVVSFLAVPLSFCGLYITHEYYVGNEIVFKAVGGNGTYQKQFQRLLIFRDILKFDFQMNLSAVVLLVFSGLSTRDIVIISVGFGLCLVKYPLGYKTRVSYTVLIVFKLLHYKSYYRPKRVPNAHAPEVAGDNIQEVAIAGGNSQMPKCSRICAVLFIVWTGGDVALMCYKLYCAGLFFHTKRFLAYATIGCGTVDLLDKLVGLALALDVYRSAQSGLLNQSVTACGQRGSICSTHSLRVTQVTSGRREDPDPQQPGSARRMSGCQEEVHLTRTATVDRSDVKSKDGLKRRQQQRWTEATSTAKMD